MTAVRSNNLSLKNQRFTPSGFNDIGIKKLEFVARTQFLKIEKTGRISPWLVYKLCILYFGVPMNLKLIFTIIN